MAYMAAAKIVKVRVGGVDGSRVAHIVRAGEPLPEGVEASEVDRLVARGMVVAVPASPSFPEGEPSERWTVEQLTAFASSKGIDLGDAKTKADKFAAVSAATVED